MENVDRVVSLIEEEMLDVNKKMRKLRDKGHSWKSEYTDLQQELAALNAAWDILT